MKKSVEEEKDKQIYSENGWTNVWLMDRYTDR